MNLKLSLVLLITFICGSYGSHEFTVAVTVSDNNEIARRAILQSFREFNAPGRKVNIKLIEITSNTDQEYVCNSLYANKSYPSLIIDVSERNDQNSGYVRHIARQLGLPTVSVVRDLNSMQFNEWSSSDEIEKELLVPVLRPNTVISTVIESLISTHFIRKFAILTDNTIEISAELRKELNDVSRNYSVHPIDNFFKQTIETLKKQKVTDFFVLGSISKLNEVLKTVQLSEMFAFHYSWFLITNELGKLNCATCNLSYVTFIQPMSVKKYEYDYEANLETSRLNKVSAFFYYDLTRFTLQITNELMSKSKWLKDLSFPNCGSELSVEQKEQRKSVHFASELSIEGFYGKFGRFVVNSDQFIAYQQISMRINRVELWRKQPFVYIKTAEWISEYPRGTIMHTSPFIKFYNVSFIDTAPPERFKTATVVGPPFIMKRINGDTGKMEYYGYCIDLMDWVRRAIYNKTQRNFYFDLYEVADGQYGVKNDTTQEWNGLIGDVFTKKADIAVGPVAVMDEREKVVDFTVPYYDLVGISLMMKKPIRSSHIFKFLSIFTEDLWMSLIFFYFLSSFALFIMDRLSPYSYYNNPRRYVGEHGHRNFNFSECLWFSITSMTPQGGGECPKAPSGKIVIAFWWFICFGTTAVYTGNLAAFLTVARLDPPIETLVHLSDQFRIRYATISDSFEETYFKRRTHIERQFYSQWLKMAYDDKLNPNFRGEQSFWEYPIRNMYTNIYKQMKITGMPNSFEEGLRRVLKSQGANTGFVLLAESTKVRWTAMTNCDIIQSGNEFSRRPVAFAIQEGNDELRNILNSAILQLTNDRKLEILKERWWGEGNPERKKCLDHRKNLEVISIRNIGGIFVIIGSGIGFAFISLFFDRVIMNPRYTCLPHLVDKWTTRVNRFLGLDEESYWLATH